MRVLKEAFDALLQFHVEDITNNYKEMDEDNNYKEMETALVPKWMRELFAMFLMLLQLEMKGIKNM